MKSITNKKNLIKDHATIVIVSVLILSLLSTWLINLNHSTSILLTFEQTIFVILSAILFVFHEAVIGYSTISKIRNSINSFKKKNIKNQVLLLIGDNSIEKDYDEFLNTVEDDILVFQENITEFKRKSFVLYSVFAILGLMIIALSMIDSDSLVFSYFSFFENRLAQLASIKHRLIDFFLIMQILTLPIWVVSAFQAEKQKNDMLKYFDIDTISIKIIEYVEQTRKKSISLSLNGLGS